MKTIVAESLCSSDAHGAPQSFALLLEEVHATTTGLIEQFADENGLTRVSMATAIGSAMDSRIARADDHEKVILFASSAVAGIPLSGATIERCEIAAQSTAALRILFWAAYRRLTCRSLAYKLPTEGDAAVA